jgi:hypothetical protein
MRFGSALQEKAVLALEEAVQECRYRAPRRSLGVRLALAFLWSASGRGDREPFERFWGALAREDMWRGAAADQALSDLCRAAGVARCEEAGFAVWQARFDEERGR